jgi:hypothetical protein
MSKPLRILILEDRRADPDLVRCELDEAGFGFVAKTVTAEREFPAELRNSAPRRSTCSGRGHARLPGCGPADALYGYD